MKRMDSLKANQVYGGTYYSGTQYKAAGVTFSCNHGCSASYYKKAHEVTKKGNAYTITHYCISAP